MSGPRPDAPEVPTQRLPEPGDRGELNIDRSVLRKVAEYAADSVAGCIRVRRRIAGVGLGEHGTSARVSGPLEELRVALDVALEYPLPVRSTVQNLRERVDEEIARITGHRTRSVDVTVAALRSARRAPRVE